jgi:hypothetical protein
LGVKRPGAGHGSRDRGLESHSGHEYLVFVCVCVCVCKMDLREVGWDGVDWIDLAQDRDRWRAYVNAVMNLRVP